MIINIFESTVIEISSRLNNKFQHSIYLLTILMTLHLSLNKKYVSQSINMSVQI